MVQDRNRRRHATSIVSGSARHDFLIVFFQKQLTKLSAVQQFPSANLHGTSHANDQLFSFESDHGNLLAARCKLLQVTCQQEHLSHQFHLVQFVGWLPSDSFHPICCSFHPIHWSSLEKSEGASQKNDKADDHLREHIACPSKSKLQQN